MQLSVNGEIAGGEVRLPREGGTVEVDALMESAFPVDRLELIRNGEVVERIPLGDGGRSGSLRKRIEVERSGWYTLRASSQEPVSPIDDTHLHGETGPVFVYCGEQPIRSRQDAEYFIRWIDDITRQAREHPGWRSDKEREHVLGQFEEARAVFEQRAREAAP